jgi:hydrogenase expression/formation protein HypD
MPATAITLQQAKARGVDNFFFFCQHITLIPPCAACWKSRKRH